MTLSKERKRHAMHEAGHAVFRIVHGFPFHHVEIDIDDGTGDMSNPGQVAGAGLNLDQGKNTNGESPSCAALRAENNQKNARLTVVDTLMTGYGDFHMLVDSLIDSGFNAKSKFFHRYTRLIFKEAHDFVVEHRALHALLTEALLERSRLTWDECLALKAQCTGVASQRLKGRIRNGRAKRVARRFVLARLKVHSTAGQTAISHPANRPRLR